MKTIHLEIPSVHKGNLILVNQAHGYRAKSATTMVPAMDGQTEVLLHRSAVVFLNQLMAEIDGWDSIVPVSGWRSLLQQQEIWDSSLAVNGLEFTKTYVAVPGHSEHQTGLAIDLGLKQKQIDFIRPDFPYEGICQAFRKKAAKYGFVERYPKGKEPVTKIGHEPWHFRYVGVPHAEIMAKHGFVLEEYIDYIRQFLYGKAAYLLHSGKQEIAVSFVKASQGQATFELDDSASHTISGNNIDGWILTQWSHQNE